MALLSVVLFVLTLIVVAFVAVRWTPEVERTEREICVCPNCVAPLLREGATLWTPPPGRKRVVTLSGQVIDDPEDGSEVLCRFAELDTREIAWGQACEAHPTEEHRQATNFVTAREDVIARRTAARRSIFAPFYRLQRRVRRALWWRAQLKANTVNGPIGGA